MNVSYLDRLAAELDPVLSEVDQTEIEDVARLVAAARGAVHCTGQGRSGYVASMAAMRLMHLGFPSHVAGEATAPAVGRGDVLLAISGSGTTHVTRHFARLAHDSGASVVLLTRNAAVGDCATRVIRIPATSSAQPGGNLFEQAALLVLDAIVWSLADEIPDAPDRLRARHTNLQ